MKNFLFYWLTVILGITFGIKLLEQGEKRAIDNYEDIHDEFKFMDGIIKDELIGMINEERLNYVGSIVLGLNDALVELTGALAGYTFAFQNSLLIALAGVNTGISAAFSMVASEYLAT